MKFTGSADTGIDVPLDSAPQAGGEDSGLRPMELIATGLAGCTAMDVISILRKKRQQITAFEVQVHAERSEEHPKVFTRAVIEYLVTGHDVDEKAVLRSIELSASRYCPAQAMFEGVFPMELKYKIFAASGEGQGDLVSEGEYTPEEAAV